MTGDSPSQTSDGEAGCGGSTLNEEQTGETIQDQCEGKKNLYCISIILFAIYRFIPDLDCMCKYSQCLLYKVFSPDSDVRQR